MVYLVEFLLPEALIFINSWHQYCFFNESKSKLIILSESCWIEKGQKFTEIFH